MRFLYARFKGYIKFNSGMGISELKIDFSRCRNRICIISGRNGCGKSTLLEALTPLPDKAEDFIPNVTAEKELHYMDGDNVYICLMVSTPNSKGRSSKAYMLKNGIELNPNGNISTYKDLLFSEFELDPSYITLLQLSITDKGLVGKGAADRSRFFSHIISAVETYNNMNKIFIKKSNLYKSHLNTLSNKINSIGDENTLYSTLNAIKNRIESLSTRKSKLEADNIAAQSYINIVDKDGSIQQRYQEIYNRVLECNKELDRLNKSIEDIDNIEDKAILEKNIMALELAIENDSKKLLSLLDEKEEDLHILAIKQEKISNLKIDYDLDTLIETIDYLKTTIAKQENIFKSIGVNSFNISREECIFIFNTLDSMKTRTLLFISDKEESVIQDSCRYAMDEKAFNTFKDETEYIEYMIGDKDKDIKAIEIAISTNKSYLDRMKILENRPKKCKINDCPLIVDAYNISKQEPAKAIKNLLASKEEISASIDELIKILESNKTIIEATEELLTIINFINSNSIVDKIPVSRIFRDTNEYITRVLNHNSFSEIKNIALLIQLADEIEDYRDNKERLIKLESDLLIYKNKEAIINEISNEILSIQKSLEGIEEESIRLIKSITFNKSIIEEQKKKLEIINRVLEVKNNIEEIKKEKSNLVNSYNNIKEALVKIKEYLDTINHNNNELTIIDSELKPIMEQSKQLEYSAILLQQYHTEYAQYSDKYNIVNKLKKYSSPSQNGIQTLFIETYMSKTLSLCNQLLSLLFNGELMLCRYVIGNNEFRIPFISGGMEVDDITSGSSSQIAMMSMIVNFVLLYQASTKYNIAGIDELDETLDTNNRLMYSDVIHKIVDILNIEQCIIISHSPEINRNNMDVIQLAENSIQDCYNEGNIIFNYYQDVNF